MPLLEKEKTLYEFGGFWVLDFPICFASDREMGRRILNDALRTIVNAERRGKASVELKPISTVMSSFLRIMKEKGEISPLRRYSSVI